MKNTYNRLAAGERLRLKRNLLGYTQDEMAEKIGRATKYYADIERGSCGMSVETLMALSSVLDMPLDYIIYGKTADAAEESKHSDEITAIIELINASSPQKQKYALSLLKLFLNACSSPSHEDES